MSPASGTVLHVPLSLRGLSVSSPSCETVRFPTQFIAALIGFRPMQWRSGLAPTVIQPSKQRLPVLDAVPSALTCCWAAREADSI